MTSKSDPRGHPGLKLCVHVSVMGYYRFINFHQNRRGSGIFLGDFTWNDPKVGGGVTAHSHARLQFRYLGNRSALTLKPHQKQTYLLRPRSFIAKHGVLLVTSDV